MDEGLGQLLAAAPIGDCAVSCREITVDFCLVPSFGVADVKVAVVGIHSAAVKVGVRRLEIPDLGLLGQVDQVAVGKQDVVGVDEKGCAGGDAATEGDVGGGFAGVQVIDVEVGVAETGENCGEAGTIGATGTISRRAPAAGSAGSAGGALGLLGSAGMRALFAPGRAAATVVRLLPQIIALLIAPPGV